MTTTQPKLGDFGLVRTPDLGGRVIRLGTDSWMNHAFIYTGPSSQGDIIEARPGGAGFNTVAAYSDPKYRLTWSTDLIPLTDAQRSTILIWAVAQLGVKYNWADIGALSLKTFGISSKKINHIIEDRHRLICSQLVDKAYDLAGVHLFTDGRLSGDVTPGDLWNLILDRRND